jgi:hypothetical protein
MRTRDRSVGIMTTLRAGRPVFDSHAGNIFFVTVATSALGPTQPPASYPMDTGVKQPAGDDKHSSPSTAEVKNAWSFSSTTLYVCKAWCYFTLPAPFTFLQSYEYQG